MRDFDTIAAGIYDAIGAHLLRGPRRSSVKLDNIGAGQRCSEADFFFAFL